MSQDLQQNRYDQLIRRVGGIIGPGSKVVEALGELFPVIDVENVPGELLRLMNTYLAFGGASVTGAAGQSGRVGLFNPVASGNLIAVSHVDVGTTSTDTIRYGVSNTVLTTGVGTEVFRDLRRPIGDLPVGQIRTMSAAALAPATGTVRMVGQTMWRIEDPNAVCILLPGTGLEVGSTLNAIEVRATFFWRERVAEQSELNF